MRYNCTVVVMAFAALLQMSQAQVKVSSSTFGAIEARHIGPAVMGGRIAALDVVNRDPRYIYVGAAGGGLWKSRDGGTTFKPVFDKYCQSIGAVTIDQNHPDTVWVGSGESWTRNSTSIGDGIYKSTDGGDNWQRVGLENSERIARIVIHPTNPNIVYAAATGHLWNDNEERGLYRTSDGGKTWEHVLYVDAKTGCADVAIDPKNPDVVYCSMWQFRRTAWSFASGGKGSGMYKSTDGGKTWNKLTNGMPEGDLGRIAIDVSPVNSKIIYANIEAAKTGFYRSTNAGESWERMNGGAESSLRPFYFSKVVADPVDSNRVYKTSLYLGVSTDGGKSFSSRGGFHSDVHAVWVNPGNSNHVIIGTDGGMYVSFDRASSWRFFNNLPLAQFYHISYDMDKPYNVYGGLQDNGSWQGPSESPNGIENRDWNNAGGGDGFWVWRDKTDKTILYSESQGGNITRIHTKTNESKDIKPYPKYGEPKYRFNWNTPIQLSPTRPDVIYMGSQFLHKSTDKGESWTNISPDLTTNDKAKQQQEESGGLSVDNSSAENHCTIYTIAESPMDANIIWVGTDDGNVQVTQNGGKSWTNVVKNIPGLPANTWCTTVEPGHFAKGTCYVTFDGHTTGDMKSYIYKTSDFGKTWTEIASGVKGYVHVVREDLVNQSLLFAGTELGMFVSIDGGKEWSQFTGNLPNVAVRDIAIHPREHDLILATHGRGVLIIDDIIPLRKLTADVLDKELVILEGRPNEMKIGGGFQEFSGGGNFVGSNPSDVATITYYQKDRHVFGDMKIEISDKNGKLISTIPAGKRKGINRIDWAIRLKAPKVAPGANVAGGAMIGPLVPEGTYTVKLLKGEKTYTGTINLVADPLSTHSAADRAMQSKAVLDLYDMQGNLAYIADAVTGVRDAATARAGKIDSTDALAIKLKAFAGKLDSLHKTLVATKEGGILVGEEQLRERVVDLYGAINSYGGKPTKSQLERMDAVSKELTNSEKTFGSFVKTDLETLNAQLTAKKLPAITVITRAEFDKKD